MASGTDKMSDRIPVGSSRLYVRAGPERTFDAWIEGLKAGIRFPGGDGHRSDGAQAVRLSSPVSNLAT